MHKGTVAIATSAVLAVLALASIGLAAQDRYEVKSPNGISFSEFKGYDAWQVIAPSQVKDGVKVILGNEAMINAYKQGIPNNGKPFPDGAKVAKIEWSKKPNSPRSADPSALVPNKLKSVSFIMKDSKRFPDTSGWGYAQFIYDADSDSFHAYGKDASFGKTVCFKCHTSVAARDYIFTAYPPR